MSQQPPVAAQSAQMPRPISPPRTPARFHQPKYHKVLHTPLYTKNIDLKRASEWLTDYFTKDCPTDFMPAIRFDLMGHIEDHDMPDGVVAQARLLDMNVIPVREVEKMMHKFWDKLVREQSRNQDQERAKADKNQYCSSKDHTTASRENISRKCKGSSPPKGLARQDRELRQDMWGWPQATPVTSKSLRSSPPSSAPGDSKRSCTDPDRARPPRVHGRDAHIDDLSRRAHRASTDAHSLHSSSSSHKFINQYSPPRWYSSRSHQSSHQSGYSPSFFARVSQ